MRLLLVLMLALALGACSQGVDGTGARDDTDLPLVSGVDGTGAPVAAVETEGKILGTITGFGSVHVNGMHLDVSSASLSIDGLPVAESALRVGMPVAAEGWQSGTEGRVEQLSAESLLLGAIDSVEQEGLVMLGQQVRFDDLTVIEDELGRPLNLAVQALAEGDRLRVFGYVSAAGELVATLVQQLVTLDANRLTGVVSDLEPTGFRIGAQRVGSLGAAVDTAAGDLVDGAVVRTIGLLVQDEFRAASIEVLGPPGAPGDWVSVEGLVRDHEPASGRFRIGRQPARLSGMARERRLDAHAAMLMDGQRGRAFGRLDADGVLQVAGLLLKLGADIALTVPAAELQIDGDHLHLFGIDYQLTADTQFRLPQGQPGRMPDENSFNPSEAVQVQAYTGRDGLLRVTRIDYLQRSVSVRQAIRAPVASVDAASGEIVLANQARVQVNCDAGTVCRQGERVLSQAEFIESVTPGSVLELLLDEDEDGGWRAGEVRLPL